MNLGSQQIREDKAPSSKQTYDLRIRTDCTRFVEQYKNSEYLAVAIVLTTFEVVRLSDLSELKTLLLEELPIVEPAKADDIPPPQNPYIAMDTFLNAIGGEWSINQGGQQCVGLGPHSQQALQNLWEQFPSLRSPIYEWLIHLCQVYEFHTIFDAYQIVCAFVRVISLDFEDAQKQLFPRLYSHDNNVGLLANIICKLHGNIALQGKTDRMLLDWLDSGSKWLWRPACLALSFLTPDLDHSQFDAPLKKIISRCLNHLTRNDSAFISILLVQSEYFQTLIAALLGAAVQRSGKHAARLAAAQTYLYLLRDCYYLVDADRPALPLAACDTEQQQQFLTPILREVMSHTILRRQLYSILQAYMKELSHYQYSQLLFDHLCAFFYNMARSVPDYWPDILQFLEYCKGKLPQQIYERLRPMYHPVPQSPSCI